MGLDKDALAAATSVPETYILKHLSKAVKVVEVTVDDDIFNKFGTLLKDVFLSSRVNTAGLFSSTCSSTQSNSRDLRKESLHHHRNIGINLKVCTFHRQATLTLSQVQGLQM